MGACCLAKEIKKTFLRFRKLIQVLGALVAEVVERMATNIVIIFAVDYAWRSLDSGPAGGTTIKRRYT
jgi:hypothetical protein